MARTDAAGARGPALRFGDADFSYGGPPALTGVTGELGRGEALALIGPNGSGKTTLLRGILRSVTVTGTMEVLGGRVRDVRRGAIGYVPQVADLDPEFPVTVRQVVEMGLFAEMGWFGRLTRSRRTRVDAALDRVDMRDRASRRFGDLSGGQRQRVLLARCIVADPELILLDEPFNGLDEPNRRALIGIIRDLKAAGVAVAVSTHDLSLAQLTCEKVLLVANRQVAFGPRDEVLVPEYIDRAYGGRGSDQLLGTGLGADGATAGREEVRDAG